MSNINFWNVVDPSSKKIQTGGYLTKNDQSRGKNLKILFLGVTLALRIG